MRFEGRDSSRVDDDEQMSEELVKDHIASMPRKYRQIFDESAMRAHAAIVARRGDDLGQGDAVPGAVFIDDHDFAARDHLEIR